MKNIPLPQQVLHLMLLNTPELEKKDIDLIKIIGNGFFTKINPSGKIPFLYTKTGFYHFFEKRSRQIKKIIRAHKKIIGINDGDSPITTFKDSSLKDLYQKTYFKICRKDGGN